MLTLWIFLVGTIQRTVSMALIDAAIVEAGGGGSSSTAYMPRHATAEQGDLAARRTAADQLISAATEKAIDISDSAMRSQAYSRIAEVQLKLGDVAAAKETAAKIDRDDKNRIYEQISAAEATAGDVAAAMETASRIKGHDDWVYRRIVAAQARVGNVRGAEETVEKIADGYAKRSALRAIVAAQLKVGDIAGAKTTVERIIGGPWSEVFLYAGDDVHGLIEIGSLQRQAGDAASAIRTLEAASNAAAAVKQANAAVPLLLNVASAQVKMEDIKGVGRTLAAARKAAARIPDKSKPSAYHAVFAAQVMADDLAGAKAEAAILTDQFDGHDLRPVAYGGIALAQSERGDLAGARATLAKAGDDDERQSFGKAWTCARIASLQAEAGDIENAKVMAADAGPWRGFADHDIVKAQVRRGDIAAAKKTAGGMDDERRTIEAYVVIAEAQAKQGHVADACRTLDLAEALAAKSKDENGVVRYVIHAREKAGDLAGALATATKLGEWRIVASLQAKAGNTAAASETWTKAIAAATQNAKTANSLDAALAGIADDQIKFGDLVRAKLTASKIASERMRQHVCEAIIAEEALAGDVAGAIEYAASLSDDQFTRCVRLVEAAKTLCPPNAVKKSE